MNGYVTEADKIKNEIINLINLPYNITIKLINSLNPFKHDEKWTELKKYNILLKTATNYEQWCEAAGALDRLEGKEAWKEELESDEYDYELISSRLSELKATKAKKDYAALMYLLRSSLSRKLGDMGNLELYAHCRVGTKKIIEEYIAEVVDGLHMLADADEDKVDLNTKYDFFLNTRQSLGRTALLFSGGATLGLKHLGVFTALNRAKLLPRIISGASAGSIFAAIFCTRTEEDVTQAFTSGSFDFTPFEDISQPDVVINAIKSFLQHGHLFDGESLKSCLRKNIGEFTFSEAYNATRKILNITISTSTTYEMPRLLNYVTAPNVLIWSAVLASCSIPYVFKPSTILAKDKDGKIVPWNPSGHRWIDGSVETDLPMQKLSELFNVNHFIVTQVNPHVVPFLKNQPITKTSPKWLKALSYLIKEEFSHRIYQMIESGIFRSALFRFISIINQRYTGDITIVPNINLSEYLQLVSNPKNPTLIHHVLTGQQATWPQIPLIANHCKIELCIDELLHNIKCQIVLKATDETKRTTLNSQLDSSNNFRNGTNSLHAKHRTRSRPDLKKLTQSFERISQSFDSPTKS